MFCCTLLYAHSIIAIFLMGKRELVALLNLSSWCLMMVERLFLPVPWGYLPFEIVVFPDHTHLLFSIGAYDILYITLNTSIYDCGLAHKPTLTKHIDTVLLNQLLTIQLYGQTNLIVLLLFGNNHFI